MKPDAIEEILLQIVKSLESPLIGYAESITNSLEDAQDIAQNIFCKAFRKLQRRDDPLWRPTRAWCFSVCRNESLNCLRRRQYRSGNLPAALGSVVDERPTPSEALLLREKTQDASNLIRLLSKPQQEALRLKSEGLKGKEIAKIMRVSHNHVRKLLSEALNTLRQKLALAA